MIRRANEKDIPDIEAILQDAVEWMTANNIPNLWNKSNTQWDSLSKNYKINEFYLAYNDNEPVGCMAITAVDETYWPEVEYGASLYIHKLAVMQKSRGSGIAKELMDYAKEKAYADKARAIRLDCNADRKRLRNIYEENRFQYVKTVCTDQGYKLALFLWDVEL